ncbi:MAG: V-type ATPase subunit [Candidatus Anstonellales archaeon]
MSLEFLNAYLSAIRSTLLTDNFLADLSKLNSISSVYEMLKKTDYGKYFDYRDSIKSTIEKGLFKRFNDVVNRIRKHITDHETFIYMIAEYESKNLLIMLDEKYRNVEHPKVMSFLDKKEYLITEYKRKQNVIGFLKATTLGKFIKITSMEGFDTISYSIDEFVIRAKREIAKRSEILSRVLMLEIDNRAYLINKYYGRKIINYRDSNILPQIRLEHDLFKAEQYLNEFIFSYYKNLYPKTWFSIDKAYVLMKLLDRERKYINAVINREDWSVG